MKKTRKKAKNNNLLLKSLVLLTLFVAVLSAISSNPKNSVLKQENSLLINTENALDISYIKPQSVLDTDLRSVVENSLKDKQGNYGIYIKNLKTGEVFELNEDSKFVSASLYKLWLMATVYQQINSGLYSEENVLSDYIANLNSYFGISPEYQEQTRGTITLSVKDALYQTITYSDNYSALLLAKKVDFASVSKFLQNEGFAESSIGEGEDDPMTTAKDTALFFTKIYNKELVNEGYSNKMLNLLQQQTLNSKLPKYLPSEVITAHKTGELYNFSHDAGIVYTSDGDYIFVALTETDNNLEANETIAKLSENVFNYFSN